MLKFVDVMVVFQELPDEITLAINISGCPCHCQGCHSSYLANDVGLSLTIKAIAELLQSHEGVSAICFMGGDADPKQIEYLSRYILLAFPDIKVGWYSGREQLYDFIDYSCFHYVKVGSYIANLGPLSSPTTNQKLYAVSVKDGDIKFQDITFKMQNGIINTI